MATAAVQHPLSTLTPHLPQATPRLSENPAPRDVHTTLNYYKPKADGSPPDPNYVANPSGFTRRLETRPITIHDIAGREAEFTLDGNGFQIVRHESNEKEFVDDEKLRTEYYAETEKLLKDVTGATRVFIFDHTIRRASPDSELRTNSTLRSPVQYVHVDQSYRASLNRVAYHLPEDAPELLKSRVQIINVWRPIKTVQRDPLAVAEASSVDENDLVPVPLIYPDRQGETLSVKAGERHRWYWKSEQRPDEVLLIKCFDSKLDGRARRVPHSAFVDPEGEGKEARESIEVRCLVFQEGESLE